MSIDVVISRYPKLLFIMWITEDRGHGKYKTMWALGATVAQVQPP